MNLQPYAPALALAGTILVGLLGFYQWRKQNGNPNRLLNVAARRAAYEGLWQKLEQLNLDLRANENASIADHLRDINTYFISNSLHFDDNDQADITEYVKAMNVLQDTIFKGNISESENYKLTGQFQTSPLVAYDVAYHKIQLLRAKIKQKAQKVAGSI